MFRGRKATTRAHPGRQVVPGSGLFNGARVENPRLFAARAFGVHDGGHLAVGLTARNDGWRCSPLLVSTGTSSYVGPDSSKNSATLAGRSRAREAGRPAAEPAVLVALWLYTTVEGVGSARKLERLAQSDAAYRWLAGGVPLNYYAFADFRVESVEVLDRLLT
jgi:hypothetical protein